MSRDSQWLSTIFKEKTKTVLSSYLDYSRVLVIVQVTPGTLFPVRQLGHYVLSGFSFRTSQAPFPRWPLSSFVSSSSVSTRHSVSTWDAGVARHARISWCSWRAEAGHVMNFSFLLETFGRENTIVSFSVVTTRKCKMIVYTLYMVWSFSASASFDMVGSFYANASLNMVGSFYTSASLNMVGSFYTRASLDVVGSFYEGAPLDVVGYFYASAPLDVVGSFYTSASLKMVGSFNARASLNIVGSFYKAAALDVVGPLGISASLDVVGSFRISAPLDVVGSLSVSASLDVVGSFRISASLDVAGPLGISAPLLRVEQHVRTYFEVSFLKCTTVKFAKAEFFTVTKIRFFED